MHGTSFNLGYSQVDVLPVLQIASVTGIWGVSFLVSLVASCAASAVHRRTARLLIPAVAAMAVVLLYGGWRLSRPGLPGGVKVGLAATDEGVERAYKTEDAARARETARAGDAGGGIEPCGP